MFTLKHILQPCDVLQDGSWDVCHAVQPTIGAGNLYRARCTSAPIGKYAVTKLLYTYPDYDMWAAADFEPPCASRVVGNIQQQLVARMSYAGLPDWQRVTAIRYTNRYGIIITANGTQIN